MQQRGLCNPHAPGKLTPSGMINDSRYCSFVCVLQHEPLYLACEKGDLVKVRWLIDEGADVNWRNKKEVQQCLQCITDCSFTILNCSDSGLVSISQQRMVALKF